jgi:hypothetical protein
MMGMILKNQLNLIKAHAKTSFLEYGDNLYSYRDVYEKAKEFLDNNNINNDLGLNLWYYHFSND